MSEALGELGTLTGALGAVGGPMSGDLSTGLNTLAGVGGLLGTGGTNARLPGSVVRAQLGELRFAVNPTGVSLGKQSGVEGNKVGLVVSDFQQSVRSTGALTIDLKGIQLLGPNTMRDALYLISLTTPVPKASTATALSGVESVANTVEDVTAATGAGVSPLTLNPTSVVPSAGGKVDYMLPVVTFSWGQQLTRDVTVKKVDVTITRFSGLGAPISAELSINLLEWVTPAAPTNPTSGGPPGRATHTVTEGDGIVRLAVRTYGDPSAWRAIAVANGLDDPLRLAPGEELYLPGPGELADVLAADAFEVSGA